jgi:hypothetical protein
MSNLLFETLPYLYSSSKEVENVQGAIDVERLILEGKLQDLYKQSFVNSMLKWNRVYYFSYDENGNRISNKVINIIQGDKDNYNLRIIPCYTVSNGGVASAGSINNANIPNPPIDTEYINGTHHSHYEKWEIMLEK